MKNVEIGILLLLQFFALENIFCVYKIAAGKLEKYLEGKGKSNFFITYDSLGIVFLLICFGVSYLLLGHINVEVPALKGLLIVGIMALMIYCIRWQLYIGGRWLVHIHKHDKVNYMNERVIPTIVEFATAIFAVLVSVYLLAYYHAL